jgi:hypothetical protein
VAAEMKVRIASWSGPRNISTAMMRSWGSRPDCVVVDEPFYACYLLESGADHPMRDDIIASQPTTREGVVDALSAQSVVAIQFEKHMTHHVPRGVDLSWTRDLKHVFLIRSPERVIASYRQKMPSVSTEDIGIVRQRELFDEITAITGVRPPVVDSLDILKNPAHMLRQLCVALDVPWCEGAMTQWKVGSRPTDGVWASHWYEAVESSTQFSLPPSSSPELDEADLALVADMMGHYEAMARFKLM